MTLGPCAGPVALSGIRTRLSAPASGVREGCVLLMDAIAHPKLPLVGSSRCHGTIEALASVPPDPHQPDRYDERSPHTHVFDALRYFAVNGPPCGRSRSTGSNVAYGVARPRMVF